MKYVFAQVQNLTFKAHDGFKRLQEAGRPVSRKYLLRTELLKDYKTMESVEAQNAHLTRFISIVAIMRKPRSHEELAI